MAINQPGGAQPIQAMYHFDPYVYQALMSVKGRALAVETVRGLVRGVLQEVLPDHLVVRPPGAPQPIVVRIQQVVWVTPE